ncbi:hypothetical protein G6F50_016950 [Rhizopus delemar]|uniref:Uncharacterized protein n=1 Tax=Rhizopus delemar TaxID=936053 RepID=A0A9P6XRZ9_9FUNG|nr:hypothetical protein G6F50_016950 [Rhizopus delemar]
MACCPPLSPLILRRTSFTDKPTPAGRPKRHGAGIRRPSAGYICSYGYNETPTRRHRCPRRRQGARHQGLHHHASDEPVRSRRDCKRHLQPPDPGPRLQRG